MKVDSHLNLNDLTVCSKLENYNLRVESCKFQVSKVSFKSDSNFNMRKQRAYCSINFSQDLINVLYVISRNFTVYIHSSHVSTK